MSRSADTHHVHDTAGATSRDGQATVPGWLAVLLVVAPIAAWAALLVASTVILGPIVLYAVLGAYLLAILMVAIVGAIRH
ncbi:MAG TPA: hypothetical protein VH987_08880 [Candidatus Limnocylindria bacterium]|jgi:hypothetical protein